MSEWPDFEIPDTWTLTRIEELAETLRAGGTPSKKKKSYFGGDIPFAIIEDITGCGTYLESTKQTITKEGLEASSAWIVPEGSVLLSMYATIGATAINTIPLATNQAILAIIPKSTCHPEFLCYCLRAHKRNLAQLNVESTQKNVNKGIVSAFRLPLPPLQEQKSIAYILSAVQRAIETQERIIQTTTELKKALMQKLFSEGLRGEPQKETEIGLVPESWEVKPLIDTVEFIDYGVSQAIPKTPTPEGVKIVSTADIDRQGNLLYRNIRRIIVPAKTAKRLVLKDGDVLFNWRNSAELIGKTTIYAEQEEQHIFASFILRICTAERYSHNHFLKHLMNHYRKEGVFVKLARRAVNQANYNRNEISILRVPIPPYEEQVEIAKAIGSVEAKTRSHINKKLGLEALFSNLLHELMTAKTRIHELELPKTAS